MRIDVKPSVESRYTLDTIGNRTSIAILRCFLVSQRRTFRCVDISRTLGIPREKVQRRVSELVRMGVVMELEDECKGAFRINPSDPVSLALFKAFNHERYLAIDPHIRKELEGMVKRMDRDRLVSAIIYGSQARGIAERRSDVDALIVHTGRWIRHPSTLGIDEFALFLSIHIDLHLYNKSNFQAIPNLAVLDAILTGISVHGHDHLFARRMDPISIEKAVFLHRIEWCQSAFESSRIATGEGRRFFEEKVEVALVEMESLLSHGYTLSHREIAPKRRYRQRIAALERTIEKVEWPIAID